METFEDMFLAGGHANSLGRSDEVLEIVRKDNSRLGEVFEFAFHEDAWVRMRAIDTFEKIIRIKPELVRPFLDTIFDKLTKSTQPSIQWHLAEIFMEVELNGAQRDGAIDWLKDRIRTTDVDWIVSGNCMKALVYFHSLGFVAATDLRKLLQVQTDHSSKAIRKKASNLLSELD